MRVMLIRLAFPKGFTKFTRSDAHDVIAMTYRNSSNPDLAIANPAAKFEELLPCCVRNSVL